MIINVLNKVIDTDFIYMVSEMMQQKQSTYYNTWIRIDTMFFTIHFKDGTKLDMSLYGPDLYVTSKIMWKDLSKEEYLKRISVLFYKVKALRDSVINEFSGNMHISNYEFDISVPIIDLRKNGISIIRTPSPGPAWTNAKSYNGIIS